MSKRETKIVKKLECVIKQLNCREFLHHFGPKKYKFVYHALALLLKEALKCSFRRIEEFLNLLDMKVPTYSALCKMRKRIPSWIWNKLLQLTSGETHKEIAIDSSGFSKTNPSFHFLKRIDRTKPVKDYAKFSALFDIRNKKFCGIVVREKRRHDIKDFKPLMKIKMEKLYGDSAYDAEWLHEYCFERGIQTIIKPRKNVRKGFYRRKQMKNYSEKEYHKRSLIESGFSALKRKYGGNVSAKRLRNVRAELYCKAIAYNISLTRNRFSTEPLWNINL